MKKLLITVFCLSMAFAVCACDGSTDSSGGTSVSSTSSSAMVSSEDTVSSADISEETSSSDFVSFEEESSKDELSFIEISIEESETSEVSLSAEESESVETYTITYVGIKNYGKTEMEIPSAMIPAQHPTQYVVGVAMDIPDLQYLYTTPAEYVFCEYYIDAECTQPFTGISETTMGDVTVYALIQINYNTPNA